MDAVRLCTATLLTRVNEVKVGIRVSVEAGPLDGN
jgi:hypothetical protein